MLNILCIAAYNQYNCVIVRKYVCDSHIDLRVGIDRHFCNSHVGNVRVSTAYKKRGIKQRI